MDDMSKIRKIPGGLISWKNKYTVEQVWECAANSAKFAAAAGRKAAKGFKQQ